MMSTQRTMALLKNEKQFSAKKKKFVSIVVPGYNEEALVVKNLSQICQYMESLENEYQWELIFINDGSTDKTGELAESFAKTRENVHVCHHVVNGQLGRALQTAFNLCKGDYVVTLDLDLSYSPDHIDKLLTEIRQTYAQVVIASPYMKGGKVSAVPWSRKIFSKGANRFLSLAFKDKIHTLTGMVRAYDGNFVKSLNLKATDTEINMEILYKAQLLRARILEIPAHLDWSSQNKVKKTRKSSMRILRGIMSSLMSGFIFRPFMFFIVPGIILLLIAFYVIGWIFINTVSIYPDIAAGSGFFDDKFSTAVSTVFSERPHAFFVGGITLVVALQFLILGILSLQNKRYFEELFHFNTNINIKLMSMFENRPQ